MGDLLLAAAGRGDAHAVVRLLSEGCKSVEDEVGLLVNRGKLQLFYTGVGADLRSSLSSQHDN